MYMTIHRKNIFIDKILHKHDNSLTKCFIFMTIHRQNVSDTKYFIDKIFIDKTLN